jgi:hypothetical protein
MHAAVMRSRKPGIAATVVLLIASCGVESASVAPSSTPVATPDATPAEPTAAPTARASVAPPPSPGAPHTGWDLTHHAWDPPWSPMELRAAAANDDRLVVVGGKICDTPQFSYGMPCDAGIWSAPADDPSALEPVPADDDLFIGTANPIIGPLPGTTDVAAGPGGFVAIGHRGMTMTPIEPVVWFSSDGLSWQLAEMGSLFQAATLEAVTADGPGFVIVGKVTSPAAPRAAVWVSADGRAWERVPDGHAFGVGGYINTGEIPASGGMTRVTAAGGGRGLVAIGSRCEGGGTLIDPGPMGDSDSCQAAAWSSPDGIDWTQNAPDLDPQWSLTSIATTGDTVIVVGGAFAQTGQPSAGVSLISRDGAAWEATRLEDVPRLDVVVGVPDGVIAFSTDLGALRAWRSSDGRDWTEIAGIPQVEGLTVVRGIGATVAGDRLVVVGSAEVHTTANLVGFTLVGPASISSP